MGNKIKQKVLCFESMLLPRGEVPTPVTTFVQFISIYITNFHYKFPVTRIAHPAVARIRVVKNVSGQPLRPYLYCSPSSEQLGVCC